MESLEAQRAVEREHDCDRLDAANIGDRRRDDRWMAEWAGAAPRLKLHDSLHGGAGGTRGGSTDIVPRKHSDVARGGVEVVSRREVMQSQHWTDAFGIEAKDRRYYELIEDTIHDEFDYRYFVVRDAIGEIRAV